MAARKTHPTSAMAEYEKRENRVKKEKLMIAYTLDKPLVTLFCTFHVTLLPRVLKRIEVWFFTALHITFCVLKWNGIGTGMFGTTSGVVSLPFNQALPLSLGALGIPSGLMSLLLVFFNSQCYSRYSMLYSACTGMGGAVQELAQISAVHCSTQPEARWDACRYLLASVLVVYMRVEDLARNRKPTMDTQDWDRLLRTEHEWLTGKPKTSQPYRSDASKMPEMPSILTPQEVQILTNKEAQVLQMWALNVMWRAYKANGSEHHFRKVEAAVLACRRNTATIPNILDMPVPFPYYHALVALMFTNYTLYSITFLEMDSWLTPLAMFLIVATTTGVRELSSSLANPFGDDEVDFNHSRFMHKLRGVVTALSHPSHASVTRPPDTAEMPPPQEIQQPPQPQSQVQPQPQRQQPALSGVDVYAPADDATQQEYEAQYEAQLQQWLLYEKQLAQQVAQAEYPPPLAADASHLVMQPADIGVGVTADAAERLALERSLLEQKERVQELQTALAQAEAAEAAAARAAPEAVYTSDAGRQPFHQLFPDGEDGDASAASVVAPPRLAPISDTRAGADRGGPGSPVPSRGGIRHIPVAKAAFTPPHGASRAAATLPSYQFELEKEGGKEVPRWRAAPPVPAARRP
jgi:predicted membrane chloride channel (bestrophin family)